MQQICEGLKNKEIAQALSITAGTVKVHLMHIFEKTGVKDRFELAIQGRKLLGLDTPGVPRLGPRSEDLPEAGAKVHAPARRITKVVNPDANHPGRRAGGAQSHASPDARRAVPLYAMLAVIAFCAFWVLLGSIAGPGARAA